MDLDFFSPQEPEQVPNTAYDKPPFERKLSESGLVGDFTREALGQLGASFTLGELQAAISRATERLGARDQQTEAVVRKTLMLAQSNYEVEFPSDSRLSERVLFPTTPAQSNGIEDARFGCSATMMARAPYSASREESNFLSSTARSALLLFPWSSLTCILFTSTWSATAASLCSLAFWLTTGRTKVIKASVAKK